MNATHPYSPSLKEILSVISFDFALNNFWYLFPIVRKCKPKIEKVQLKSFTAPIFFIRRQQPPNLWERGKRLWRFPNGRRARLFYAHFYSSFGLQILLDQVVDDSAMPFFVLFPASGGDLPSACKSRVDEKALEEREIFLTYLDECPCPKLQSGDVVVMDNLSCDKDPRCARPTHRRTTPRHHSARRNRMVQTPLRRSTAIERYSKRRN